MVNRQSLQELAAPLAVCLIQPHGCSTLRSRVASLSIRHQIPCRLRLPTNSMRQFSRLRQWALMILRLNALLKLMALRWRSRHTVRLPKLSNASQTPQTLLKKPAMKVRSLIADGWCSCPSPPSATRRLSLERSAATVLKKQPNCGTQLESRLSIAAQLLGSINIVDQFKPITKIS